MWVMTKRHAPWAIIAILFVSYGVGRLPGLLIAATVLAVAYFVSVRLHPRIACRTCKGTGKFYGWIFTWVWRNCHKCLGSGRKVRYGASMWGTPTVRAEAEATKAAVKEAPRGRWVE